MGQKGVLRCVAAFVLCCAAAAFVCSCEKKKKTPEMPPPVVAVVNVVHGERSVSHEMPATVRAFEKIQIIARVSGFLAERPFKEGASVKKGDLLYLIEPAQYVAAVKSAEARLMRAKASALQSGLEYERVRTLHSEKITSVKRFDSARAGMESGAAEVLAAEAALVEANLNLSYTRITAPFDGWIGFNNVDTGNYISAPSEPLAELVETDKVRVEFNVSDAYLTDNVLKRLARGEPPEWKVALLIRGGIYPYPGEIHYWNNSIDTRTATLAMQAVFPNPERSLAPGLFARIIITEPEPEKVLLIDKRAINSVQGRSIVYVIGADGKLELRMPQLGDSSGESRVVISGLSAGEKAVIAANPYLRPGIAVRIAE